MSALKAVPGVRRVDARLHLFQVVYDPARVTPEQVTRLLEENDFKVGDVTVGQ